MNTVRRQIGRAKAALVQCVGGEPAALVSAVTVRKLRGSGSALRFAGAVEISATTRDQIQNTIVGALQEALEPLNVALPPLEIALSNAGLASTANRHLSVTDFSADLPIFLAMLSAVLGLPLRQDMIGTGHIASPAGDLAPVEGLEEKLASAIAAEDVEFFLCPDFNDGTLARFTPRQVSRWAYAVAQASYDLEVRLVTQLSEAVALVFTEEDAALAALRHGYWLPSNDPVAEGAGSWLLRDSETRFWSALQRHIAEGDKTALRACLRTYIDHHTRVQKYPVDFGRRLQTLLLAVPGPQRRLLLDFPILPLEEVRELESLAFSAQTGDFQVLLASVEGRLPAVGKEKGVVKGLTEGKSEDAARLLKLLVRKLNARHLGQEVDRPIDVACFAFSVPNVQMQSREDFEALIEAFYLHLLRHTKDLTGIEDIEAVRAEALALLGRAFGKVGGEKAAYTEALDATNGGLAHVLKMMAQQFKQEARERCGQHTLHEALESLTWQEKVNLGQEVQQRLAALGVSCPLFEPEDAAGRCRELVCLYVQILDEMDAVVQFY